MINAIEAQKIINEIKKSFLGYGFSEILLELLDKYQSETNQSSINNLQEVISSVKTFTKGCQDNNPDFSLSDENKLDFVNAEESGLHTIKKGNSVHKIQKQSNKENTKAKRTAFYPQDTQAVTSFLGDKESPKEQEVSSSDGTDNREQIDKVKMWFSQFIKTTDSDVEELYDPEKEKTVQRVRIGKGEISATPKEQKVSGSDDTDKREQIDKVKMWISQFIKTTDSDVEELYDPEKGKTVQRLRIGKGEISATPKEQKVSSSDDTDKREQIDKLKIWVNTEPEDKKLNVDLDKQETSKEKDLSPTIQRQAHKKLDFYQQNAKEVSFSAEEQVKDQKKNFLHVKKQNMDFKTTVRIEGLKPLSDTKVMDKKESAESPAEALIQMTETKTKKDFVHLASKHEKQIKQNTDSEGHSKIVFHDSLVKEDPVHQEKTVFKIDTASNDSLSNNHIHKADLVNKLADVIHYTAESHKKEELIVHLKPEFLGRLKIKLTSEDGHLRIELFTESHLVKEVIASHVSVLQKLLIDKGIPAQEIGVFLNWQGFHEGRRFTEYKLKSSSWKVDTLKEDIVTSSSNKKIWQLEDEEGLEYWA